VAKIGLPKIKLDQDMVLRERMFFAAALAGLAFFFFTNFWTPLSERVGSLRAELNNLEVQAVALEKLLELTREKLSQASAAKEEKGPEIDDRIRKILERRVTDITEEVNSTVDKLGSRHTARRVKVGKVNVGDRIEMPGYIVVPIDVELQGPYTGIQNFMEKVEDLDRPVVIRSFEMKLDSTSPGQLMSSLRIELYIARR